MQNRPKEDSAFVKHADIKRVFGLEKNVFFMGVVSFLNDVSNQMIISSFPAFFTGFLKGSAASLGIVEGFADGMSQIMKIISGRISDKIQKRKVLIVAGYAIAVFIRPIYTLIKTPFGAFVLRSTDRFGKGVREAPRDALISLSSPKEELGKSFGYHRALDAAGSLLGPLVAFFMLRRMPENWNAIFITSFIIGLLALVSFVFVKEIGGIVKTVKNIRSDIMPKTEKKIMASFLFLAIGTIPVALILLKVKTIGLDISYIPLFYFIYYLSFTAFSLSAGKMADKIGEKRVIVIGYLFLAASYVIIAFNGIIPLIGGLVVMGLYSAATDGTTRAYVSKLSGAENRGAVIGMINGIIGIGLIVAGIIGGFFWQIIGPSMTLIIFAFIVLIAIFCFSKIKTPLALARQRNL